MQTLEPENKSTNGAARIFSLRTREELDLSELQTLMHETRDSHRRNSDSAFGVEQTSVLVIEMRHFGELPKGFAETIAQRAYDYAASQGIHMRGSDAKASVSGHALPIREMLPLPWETE